MMTGPGHADRIVVSAERGVRMAIETVVLDLDDTLVAASRSYARALSVLTRYGVDPDAFVAAHRRWWARYQRGGCTIDELYEGRMGEAGLTGDLAMEANDRFVRAAARSTGGAAPHPC
jgi:phosphoglycolate phosphatase-like HAD superfamily hydrolase